MTDILRVSSENDDFQKLVFQLDSYLAKLNGDENDFYAAFNKTNLLQHVAVGYSENMPVACGAIKKIDQDTIEIKRMYVLPEFRGKGVATAMLKALENWGKELGYKRAVLETSIKMPEAINLYRKNKYYEIPRYGQYENALCSICFEKNLW
ncbi:MAG: GNAT family N-acetyltransferase [Chitinophagales bacterium]|nr:GNAT family N-acetyltransferase [Chitinophagales bacterium]